jgi:hypothetical protein
MNQRGTQRDNGKYLDWKDYFFDETRIVSHRRRRPRYGFREDIENDQACVQKQPERNLTVALRPAACKDASEDEGKDCEHQQRAEKHPGHPEHRASVAE